ncbi:response regulator transcription factor [Catenuloplanes atrovinosus]|uniref:DNA-binding NarL/FixJ family response regulator n=1 Tax=Catenuloplanes atrovinosus TaxID=137266 RepID=A0AAE3YS58_9ACTN|nr:response regulator transcription factor [Catenuloplanes atrovinosus]MDR7276801.1 DNA-binding NarL/FixJ family response regulator [Catenuloplanes atrovinosus]
MTIRVVLADDQVLVRAGLHGLLDNSDDIRVVGEAGDGARAVAVVRGTRPDVVLMDIRMPVLDGVEAIRRITADPALAAVRIIALTTFDLDDYLLDALRAGADGFLLKDVEPEDLRRAVRVVAAGEMLVTPRATRVLVDTLRARGARTADPGRLAVLTGREREVMALAARGLANDEIGARLSMSPATARTHVQRAITKLGVRDRTQLVVLAYETGLISPGE